MGMVSDVNFSEMAKDTSVMTADLRSCEHSSDVMLGAMETDVEKSDEEVK